VTDITAETHLSLNFLRDLFFSIFFYFVLIPFLLWSSLLRLVLPLP
jgi:hypothetical protein